MEFLKTFPGKVLLIIHNQKMAAAEASYLDTLFERAKAYYRDGTQEETMSREESTKKAQKMFLMGHKKAMHN